MNIVHLVRPLDWNSPDVTKTHVLLTSFGAQTTPNSNRNSTVSLSDEGEGVGPTEKHKSQFAGEEGRNRKLLLVIFPFLALLTN